MQLGTTINWQRPGFRKLPYASRHSLLVNYGFVWSSLLLGYTSDFRRALGGKNLLVSVISKSPNYTNHFFRLGNNMAFNRDNSQTISYYRSF